MSSTAQVSPLPGQTTPGSAEKKPPRRFHQIIKLKPEHYEAYKACHAAAWPEVLEMIKKCHIEDYSIAHDPKTSLLFASFKYTGSDLAADTARMRDHEATRKWWAMTDGYQESLNPGAVSSERAGVDGVPGWWTECEEVFYLP